MTYSITLGCRLNAYESGAMEALAGQAGLKNAIIINTCAVTTTAERDSRAAVRRAARDNPDTPIIVTGCAAALNAAYYEGLTGVARVIDNTKKLDPAAWGITTPMSPLAMSNSKTRALIQVQGGCDHTCTFCVTTLVRGAGYSIPPETVIENIRAAKAYEVVLSGVDLASYTYKGLGLGGLIKCILDSVPDIGRIRLSSLDPAALDEDLWDLLESREPRLCPHLHLSVQSGDDMILKRMKRRHTRADILTIAARAQRLNLALGADIIAGFPTEDDAMFENTHTLITQANFAFCHVFTYSPRPATPAAHMPQVPIVLRQRRAAILRTTGKAVQQAFFENFIGSLCTVVVEEGGIGRTAHFAPVHLSRRYPVGHAQRIGIACVKEGILIESSE